MRLTLLWSQSTTGNYFEEESALRIEFHNPGRRAQVINVMNWYTLDNKTRHVLYIMGIVQTSVLEGQNFTVKVFKLSRKYEIYCTLYLTFVSWDGAGL